MRSSRVQAIVDEVDPEQTLTGLPLVNQELARSFVPEFLKGLAIGAVLVVVLVVAAFRNWRLSLLRAAADGARPHVDRRDSGPRRHRTRPLRCVRRRDAPRHRRRLRRAPRSPLPRARGRGDGDRGARAGDPGRGGNHDPRVRHAGHVLVSAASLDRPRLGRQRAGARRRRRSWCSRRCCCTATVTD